MHYLDSYCYLHNMHERIQNVNVKHVFIRLQNVTYDSICV